jgi:hypothetical protein
MLHHMLEHIFRLMNLFVVHLFNLCVMLEFESKEKEKKISKANGKQIEKGKQNQPNSPSSSSQPNSAWRPSTLARSPPRFTLFPPRGPAAPPRPTPQRAAERPRDHNAPPAVAQVAREQPRGPFACLAQRRPLALDCRRGRSSLRHFPPPSLSAQQRPQCSPLSLAELCVAHARGSPSRRTSPGCLGNWLLLQPSEHFASTEEIPPMTSSIQCLSPSPALAAGAAAWRSSPSAARGAGARPRLDAASLRGGSAWLACATARRSAWHAPGAASYAPGAAACARHGAAHALAVTAVRHSSFSPRVLSSRYCHRRAAGSTSLSSSPR